MFLTYFKRGQVRLLMAQRKSLNTGDFLRMDWTTQN